MDACPQVEWPAADWPEERAAGSEALDQYLFPAGLDWNDKERRGIRTDGIVIVRHGRIVYERYDHGYTQTTRHIAWSVTKSVVGTLTGMAVKEGVVALDQSVCAHVRGLPDASCAVTVEDLLEFASGFEWRETYEGHPPTTSSVLAMLYGEGQPDMAKFVGSLPLRDPPGTTFMYSSGDTMLLSGVLDAALEPTHGKDFARTMLFDPLGMTSAIFERDGAGTYVGASYLFATPRDLARFGYLWLHDGCWNGERLLAQSWMRDSLRPNEPFLREPLAWHPGEPAPGRQIWLNVRTPGVSELPWPSAPPDTFAALGHWSQGVYVIPSEDLVVVRTGDDRDATFSNDELMRHALAFARGLR
jgi:CubicO group peptidase (beta-lactamase class C family)